MRLREEKIVENWGGEAAPVLHNFSLFGWTSGAVAPSHFGEDMAFVDLIGITLLVLGLILIVWGRRAYHGTGLPAGQIISRDTAGWERPPASLVARRLGLVGRPDYLVQVGKTQVPVEVKPLRSPRRPYESDVIQLMAYCLLVEETTGLPPPYGILVYANQHWRLPYTPEARQAVLARLAEMRAAWTAANVPRSHTHPARCRACSVRDVCDQALA